MQDFMEDLQRFLQEQMLAIFLTVGVLFTMVGS
jgi:hypothetical protein